MQNGPTTRQRRGFGCWSLLKPGMTYSFTRPHPLRGRKFSIGFQRCIDAAKQSARKEQKGVNKLESLMARANAALLELSLMPLFDVS